MNDNNCTTPLASLNDNEYNKPAAGKKSAPAVPHVANRKDAVKKDEGMSTGTKAAVVGVAAVGSVAAGVGAAVAADKIFNGNEAEPAAADPAASGSEGVSGTANGIFTAPDDNGPATPAGQQPGNDVPAHPGDVVKDNPDDNPGGEKDGADSELQAGTVERTPEPGPGKTTTEDEYDVADLPDVDPNVVTADIDDDVVMIDDSDIETPGYFFDPTGIEVVNINGEMATAVEAVLPEGDVVYLVDSDNDGNFDAVYDAYGNILADGEDLASTTVDDARAVLIDRGIDPGTDEIVADNITMADVDEQDGDEPVVATTDPEPDYDDNDVAELDGMPNTVVDPTDIEDIGMGGLAETDVFPDPTRDLYPDTEDDLFADMSEDLM